MKSSFLGSMLDGPLSAKTDVLGERLAAHLLRRCSYYYTAERISHFATLTPEQAVAELLAPAPSPVVPEPIDVLGTGQPWINSGPPPTSGGVLQLRYVKAWWMENARLDPTINHRLMMFLHTVYASTGEPGTRTPRFFDHLNLLKFYALGNFRKLGFHMTLDAQMLYYLDNRLNEKQSPNENYAREFLELFTVGKGPQAGPGNYTNYTEYDVQQAARVLTGAIPGGVRGTFLDPETGILRGYFAFGRHDTGDKTFSAAFGGQTIAGAVNSNDTERELWDFVNMVFGQVETARFLCRRLYRFFVDDQVDDTIEMTVIRPLADFAVSVDYELKPIMEQLLCSHHFYGEDDTGAETNQTVGALVKSPVELVFQALNSLDMSIPDGAVDPRVVYDKIHGRTLVRYMFEGMGMAIFDPPTVAGYPAYYQEPNFSKNWFDTTAIIDRYFLPVAIIENKERNSNSTFGGRILLVRFVRLSGLFSDPGDADVIVDTLTTLLLAEKPTQERYDYFMNLFLDGLSPLNWKFEWENYIQSGDDSDVKIPLENLLKAIMYSPEYQLF